MIIIRESDSYDTLGCAAEDKGAADSIIGGDATHIFEFPFNYSSYVKSATRYYKQGRDILLEIGISPEDVTVDKGHLLESHQHELHALQLQPPH